MTIEEAKRIVRTTKSEKLRRDMIKYINREIGRRKAVNRSERDDSCCRLILKT
jgi:hypothetical protein